MEMTQPVDVLTSSKGKSKTQPKRTCNDVLGVRDLDIMLQSVQTREL